TFDSRVRPRFPSASRVTAASGTSQGPDRGEFFGASWSLTARPFVVVVESIIEGKQRSAVSRRDGLVGEVTIDGVKPECECWVVRHSLAPALVGNCEHVGQRDVGESVRRSVRYCAGHIRYAVEDAVVHWVGGGSVRGGV